MVKSEYRAFFYKKQILDVRCYSGDFKTTPDFNKIYSMLKAWNNKPIAGTIDVGVTVENKTVLIEVRVSGTDKGSAVQFIRMRKKYDFVLCMGDDTTDENMFRVLQKENAYTVKVGMPKAVTYARYSTATPATVLTFLQEVETASLQAEPVADMKH